MPLGWSFIQCSDLSNYPMVSLLFLYLLVPSFTVSQLPIAYCCLPSCCLRDCCLPGTSQLLAYAISQLLLTRLHSWLLLSYFYCCIFCLILFLSWSQNNNEFKFCLRVTCAFVVTIITIRTKWTFSFAKLNSQKKEQMLFSSP